MRKENKEEEKSETVFDSKYESIMRERNSESLDAVETPKRSALMLSPSALVQVGASPHSQRYSSIRKIDFEEGKGMNRSIKKLDFFKKS